MSQPAVRVDPGALDDFIAATEGVCRNVEELFQLLEGLGDASKEIAENYRDTEQLNGATLQAIESILGENLGPSPRAA